MCFLIYALRLLQLVAALVELSEYFGDFEVFFSDGSSVLRDFIIFLLQLACQSLRELLL